MGRWIVAVLCVVMVTAVVPSAAGAANVADIDGPEDFTLLAGDGYSYGVPGSPGDYTDLTVQGGGPDNTYNWSGVHFDPDGPGGDPGMLLMGTLQNTFDFSVPYESRLAQIWRYDIPSSGDPRQGTWTLAWESDVIFQNLFPLPECVGLRGATVTNIGGTPRAVFSCTGGQGKLIGTTDGVEFTDASTSGIGVSSGYIGFRDVAAVDWNDDGTDDALMVSPVGLAEASGAVRTDLSPDDVMLINTNPFGFFGRWRVASEPGFGDDDNFVNFATKSIDTNGDGRNDAVAAVASNRASGAQLWVATEGCGGLFGGLFGSCTMDWELVFDGGVGKPLQNVNCGRSGCDEQNPDIRNPNAYGSDFAQVGETVYVTLGETAFQGNDEAADETEVIAVYPPGSADCPAGADCSDWVVEILMGDARRGTAAELESTITNFHCTEVTTSAGTWCVPTSGRVASFGEAGDRTDGSLDWGDLDEGDAFYTWRATSDGANAWFTTAGSTDTRFGFETWRLESDGTLTLIDSAGLGDGNLGGRTLFHADPLGIVIGTASTSAGTDVFVGGCHPGRASAVPGPDRTVFDESDPQDHLVDVDLDGSASRGAPCDDLTELSWYSGTCDDGNRRPSGTQLATWSGVDDADFGELEITDLPTGGPDAATDHDFALFAVADGGSNCTDHTVTASSDLPPAVAVTAVSVAAPDEITCNGSLSGCSIADIDENTLATLEVTAECVDDTVTECTFTSDHTSTAVSPAPVLFDGAPSTAVTPSGETVTVDIDASAFAFDERCTDITDNCGFSTTLSLRAVDGSGFTSEDTLFLELQFPLVDLQIESDGGGSDACDEGVPGALDKSPVCILPRTAPRAGVAGEVWVQVENDGNVASDVTVTLDPGGNGTVTYLDDPAPFPYALPGFGVETYMKFSWTPDSAGEVTLTAEITPTDVDPDDNMRSRLFEVADAVPPAVDLEVTSVSPAGGATVGSPQTVEVTVTNNGTDDAPASSFTVSLHEGTASGGTCAGASLDTIDPVTTGLTSGTDDTYALEWTPDTDGVADLCAAVAIADDEIAANDAASTDVDVEPAPADVDLAVTDLTTTDPAEEGVAQTVTVTVTNNGVLTAAANDWSVQLFEGASAAGGTCLSGTTVELVASGDSRIVAVASTSSVEVELEWTPSTPGSETLCAEVTIADDERLTNDALDADVDVEPDTVTTHLSAFAGSLSGGNLLKFASVSVTVVDRDGTPVAGATVAFSFTRGAAGEATTTCVTNAAGSCTAAGTVWFSSTSTWTVTDVTAPDTLYTPTDDTATNPLVL